MPVVLICAEDPLADDLHQTLLWRQGLERHLATRFDEALVTAVAAQPDLVVVDRDLPQADRLVRDLRADESTRRVSIAVVAKGEMDPLELQLLDLGANAILRLPATREWDERLARLVEVPIRRETRLPVWLEFEVPDAGGVAGGDGTVVNVSRTGMLVETSLALPTGTDLDFRIMLGEGAVCGTGRIVREAEPGSYGVEFYALEGEGAARIAGLVGGGKLPLS